MGDDIDKIPGGQGDIPEIDPHHARAEIRLMRRAMRRGWLRGERARAYLAKLDSVIRECDPATQGRTIVGAVKVVLDHDKLLSDDIKRAVDIERANAGKAAATILHDHRHLHAHAHFDFDALAKEIDGSS